LVTVAAMALVSLGACDRINHKNNRPDGGDVSARMAAKAARQAERAGRQGGGAAADAPKYTDGTPVWASNRKRTAQENIDKMFRKNGSDFGAATSDAYVAKAHAFISSPPRGVQTATRTRNGDKLFYDPATNTFAVATRTGAPRIMMKPRDGKAYWTEQLTKLDEKSGYGQGKGGKGGKNRAGGYQRADTSDGASDDNG
jgi:hypothetical protein